MSLRIKNLKLSPKFLVCITHNSVSLMNSIPTVHKQLLLFWLDNILMRYKTKTVQDSNNKIFLISDKIK